jgi:glyceraldehyde 3-phosphate dehydrogenase
MRKKVAINGLGRIGKHAVRILLSRFWEEIEIVAINAPKIDAENAAYLINYDSVYGYFEEFDITGKAGTLYVNKMEDTEEVRRIQLFDTFDALTLPWKDLGIDVVIDCSGAYKDHDSAATHVTAGAKHMIISAPVKDSEIPTVVLGVNTDKIPANTILSNASCTTNCASTVLKVLIDNFGIQSVAGVTVHAYTQSQVLLDKEATKGLREGRAAGLNIIPSTTGAASAVELVLPQLKDKIDLMSMRVPVPSGSVVYLNIEVDRETSVEEINKLFLAASTGNLKDILFYSEEELVSSDIVGTP